MIGRSLLLFLVIACGGPEMDGPPAPPGNLGSGDPLRDCMMLQLPRLKVAGNKLLIQCGDRLLPTRLKGINRSGLQHKNGLAAAGFGADPGAELRRFRDEWRTVALRLPIGQTYYLFFDGYRRDIGTLVETTRALGMYLILELHGYDADNLNGAQPDPNSTPAFWAEVARRFGAEPHVLFDLWNEPHDVPWSVWKENAEKILRAIRGAGATDTLVIIGGLDWAYDLSPLLDPQNRIQGLGPIVYATHPYPLKSNPPAMAPEWEQKFGRVARELPVLVGEYGVDTSLEPPFGIGEAAAHSWMTQLHSYIDARGLSALAWSAGDKPQLTLGINGGAVSLPANPPDAGRPTAPFGVDVKAWMIKPIQ